MYNYISPYISLAFEANMMYTFIKYTNGYLAYSILCICHTHVFMNLMNAVLPGT